MAILAAAFASSHSLMLACDLDDWLTRFRQSDLRMPYFDEAGEKISYADVLARARVVDTLAQALDGITWACATAMTPRDFGPPAASPRAHFEVLLKKELLALDG